MVPQVTVVSLAAKELKEAKVQREKLVPREIKDGVDTRDRGVLPEHVEWLATKETMGHKGNQALQ